MSQTQEPVEINGIELEEGDTLWRFAALRTYNAYIGEQDPDDVLRETAEALVDNYPEAVGVDEMREQDDPYEVVHANLKANPGIYDDTDLMRYHAMEVKTARTAHGKTEVTLLDWKEEKRFVFTSSMPDDDDIQGGYMTFEPLEVLEAHLGVTILPVTEDE